MTSLLYQQPGIVYLRAPSQTRSFPISDRVDYPPNVAGPGARSRDGFVEGLGEYENKIHIRVTTPTK